MRQTARLDRSFAPGAVLAHRVRPARAEGGAQHAGAAWHAGCVVCLVAAGELKLILHTYGAVAADGVAGAGACRKVELLSELAVSALLTVVRGGGEAVGSALETVG